MRTSIIAILIGLVAISFALGFYINPTFFWLLVLTIPLLLTGLYDIVQPKHAITRNFPLIGRSRYVAEWLRPKLFQYFIEPDTDGSPFSRIFRNIVYQRAKHVLDTAPFGTQLNVYKDGYEWMNHSIAAKDPHTIDRNQRWTIGGPDCLQPYSASIFNISAMSFGSLSKNAIMAMNAGAALGGFAHNTGEGGISPYHSKHGGDLIYQIGTGYFGCRSPEGGFSGSLFKKLTSTDNVKMIEIKLSQGAKPGHGGILPAKKVTKEIAQIRSIEMGKDVISPAYHKAFDSPTGLMNFIKECRDLSGGKPIGFKLCVGKRSEFIALCKAMVETGIKPDFISVDGGEGGTGAAPLEFSNSVGMPYKEGLAFVYNTLIGFDLKKDISIIATGKIVTGFHIFRSIALGADLCYSARAMMMAVGCIQALECNKNTCPTGVATQDPRLIKGLVVQDKKVRVFNYHRETVNSFVELLAAAGINTPDAINRSHIFRRTAYKNAVGYDELYPYIPKGCLLVPNLVPESWQREYQQADSASFLPRFQQVYTE